METVIEVKDVYKSFKTVHAVRGIDLRILKGQFTAILGPNGAGKTTLVEMIEGIQKPDKGEIYIMGKQWAGNEAALHNIIGLSLQETYYIDKLNVWETLILFASFYDLKKERCAEVIALVGLEEKRKSYVVNLSGGQRQRLALGIALLNSPQILLLDEPTTGLDPLARREIWAILSGLKKLSQTSLILTTHYMEEAEQLCDNIIIIDHGRILKEGSLRELLHESNGENVIAFSFEDNHVSTLFMRADERFRITWDDVQKQGTAVLSSIENELPDFLNFLQAHNMRLKNLECKRKTLDDLFISLTGRHLHE